MNISLHSLQGKLIIPYLLLTLILAAGGMYIVTHLVTSSIRERFINQLYEAARVASDGVVRQERLQLENLHLMAFTEGSADAFAARDASKLEALLLPIAVNNQIQIVSALDLNGQEILSLGLDPTNNQILRSSGKDFSGQKLVQNVLNGVTDGKGDKFVEIIESSSGPALVTSSPVRTADGQLAGVMLVGTPLDSLTANLKAQSLADILIFQSGKNLTSSTLNSSDSDLASLSYLTEQDLTQTQEFTLNERPYQMIYTPLTARGELLGIMGVALPSNFLVSTESTNRNLFAMLFTGGTVGIILIGYFLSQSIARPILKLRSLSKKVAEGDMSQQAELQRTDEIGELAESFDQMTLKLRERTAETARLYAETLQRNQELQETNEKLKNAQRQLVQSEKLAAVGQLTAGIVHDVKNPLTVIRGLSEIMEEQPDLSEDSRTQLSMIHESAIRASEIVHDLLKFSRQSLPEMRTGDLRETVQAALRLTDYPIRKGGIQVKCSLPPEAVWMAFDPQQIEQVLINLITNAIHAMPEGGNLQIGLEVQNQTAAITVQDSGIGIAPENLDRVFDPFFTTKPEGEGTGLGLSVSYGIIACHNGQIEVESEPGQGTTFTIFLPITLNDSEKKGEAVYESK